VFERADGYLNPLFELLVPGGAGHV
jgi:hypothetical protein